MKELPAHPPEPSYPCYLSILGELAEVAPHGESVPNSTREIAGQNHLWMELVVAFAVFRVFPVGVVVVAVFVVAG
jgi:hypothetical protein